MRTLIALSAAATLAACSPPSHVALPHGAGPTPPALAHCGPARPAAPTGAEPDAVQASIAAARQAYDDCIGLKFREGNFLESGAGDGPHYTGSTTRAVYIPGGTYRVDTRYSNGSHARSTITVPGRVVYR
jgi:hypothetical protein